MTRAKVGDKKKKKTSQAQTVAEAPQKSQAELTVMGNDKHQLNI